MQDEKRFINSAGPSPQAVVDASHPDREPPAVCIALAFAGIVTILYWIIKTVWMLVIMIVFWGLFVYSVIITIRDYNRRPRTQKRAIRPNPLLRFQIDLPSAQDYLLRLLESGNKEEVSEFLTLIQLDANMKEVYALLRELPEYQTLLRWFQGEEIVSIKELDSEQVLMSEKKSNQWYDSDLRDVSESPTDEFFLARKRRAEEEKQKRIQMQLEKKQREENS